MPLSDDFSLFLNGKRIRSAKENAKRIGTWILGKDIGTKESPLPTPASSKFEKNEDSSLPADSPQRFGIFHPSLQRVTGFIEAFEDELGGKSESWGQSSGFFVYVRGRRINIEDPGFGIDRNKLQHGTFARFRMVVHIDGLDEELRSSRETVRDGQRLTEAKNLLHAGFNHARNRLKKHFDESKPGFAMASRVADSPASLTTRPIYGVLAEALEGKATPRYIEIPQNLSKEKRVALLAEFENSDTEGFRLVENSELSMLSSQDGLARYNVSSRLLRINTMHPFVAHFLNEFQSESRSLPLELFAMSEVLLEAHLYQTISVEERVQEVLERRDQLLRHLAKTTGRKTAFLIANDLEEAATDKTALELELVNAFSSLGFDAVPQGGPGKPDGVAHAHLSASRDGQRNYGVSLESKSKESLDKKVSAKAVGISAIARQRDDFNCEHAIVVGPDFPAGKDGLSALEKEIDGAKGQPLKTITLMKVSDLARLVRIQPQKRIGLDKLRELFQNCRTPEQSAKWVSDLETLEVTDPPYRDILESIWEVQLNESDAIVEYGKLRTEMRHRKVTIKDDELRGICHAMMRLAGSSYIYASDSTVELNQKPDNVLQAIQSVVTDKSKLKKKI